MDSTKREAVQAEPLIIEKTTVSHDDRFAQVTRILLENGADLNTRDRWGRTPLMIAAKAGNQEMVEVLLGWEADLHARDQRGYTALMYGAWKGHVEIVRLLIERGADVRSVDSETGYTSVLLAAFGAEEAVPDFGMDDEESDPRDRDNDGGDD